jgi:RND superfamily putative drug exporter
MPSGLLARHGAAMARHARAVALIALLLTVAGYLVAALGVGGPSLFSRLEVGEPTVSGEALTGRDLLAQNDPTGLAVQGLWSGIDPESPVVQSALAEANADLVAIPGVLQVLDPTTVGAAAISVDGQSTLTTVVLDKELSGAEEEAATAAASERLAQMTGAAAGSTVELTGSALLYGTITEQVKKDLIKGEAIALPISLVIMVLIFGGFAAAGVPLAGAIASIAGGLVTLLLFTYVLDLDATVVNVVTVLGLGLSIDYSLLIVSRYREQMHDLWDLTAPDGHRDVPHEVRERAMAITMATAGRTVIFSGVTVAIAVTGLMLIDMTIIRSVGAGAFSVVAIAVVVSTTVVPALLVLATKHVAGSGSLARLPGLRRFAGAFDHSPSDDGWFARWAVRIQHRPWTAFLSVATVLVVLSIPAWRMDLVSSGVELLPPDNPQRVLFEEIQQQFPATAQPQVTVVAMAADTSVLSDLAVAVGDLPGVERVGQVQPLGEVATLGVFTAEDAEPADVVTGIRDIRPESPETWVTGPAAILVDFTEQLATDIPVALLFIVVATLVLLFLLTGSVLVPVKALVMNFLSLGATFGVLVLIFQDGRLEAPLNFTSTGGIEAVLPVIIFAFAFGLSMDYEVFLLSRIKEFRDQGYDNDDSVRLGLQRTGRIITSAALLVVVVFAGFVLGDLLAIKQTGIALAVAVLIDATLVRIILVPATMTLIGEWNWWAPGPLRRLHDRIGVSH